jgi:hypothetical protein
MRTLSGSGGTFISICWMEGVTARATKRRVDRSVMLTKRAEDFHLEVN